MQITVKRRSKVRAAVVLVFMAVLGWTAIIAVFALAGCAGGGGSGEGPTPGRCADLRDAALLSCSVVYPDPSDAQAVQCARAASVGYLLCLASAREGETAGTGATAMQRWAQVAGPVERGEMT